MFRQIRKFLPLVLLAIMIQPAQAQKKGYSYGYVIKLEGDTIAGQIQDRSSGTFPKLYSRIHFIPDNSRGKRKYGPEAILGYGYNNQHFESMPLREESDFFQFRYYLDDDNWIFLKKVAQKRDLTYYHWEWIDGESSYIDYTPLFYRDGSREMVRVTQGILGLKRNRLMEYFKDCPDLVYAIEQKVLSDPYDVFDYYINRCKGGSGDIFGTTARPFIKHTLDILPGGQ